MYVHIICMYVHTVIYVQKPWSDIIVFKFHEIYIAFGHSIDKNKVRQFNKIALHSKWCT
jgi:hypothetical protein